MGQLRGGNNKIRIIYARRTDSVGLADGSSRVNDLALPKLVERDTPTLGGAVIRGMSAYMLSAMKSSKFMCRFPSAGRCTRR